MYNLTVVIDVNSNSDTVNIDIQQISQISITHGFILKMKR